MTLSTKSLAGPGYIILNVIRAMNIVAFLAVIAASVVMLVKTTTASKFFFFDAVSHVVTAVVSMFLLVSEMSLFRAFYARNWPLLSPAHGFVTLAIAMLVIGVDILGDLNQPSMSQETLGLAVWRIVIGSGFLMFILGFFNLFASYIFRDHKQGITARQVRAKGAVASATNENRIASNSSFASTAMSKHSVSLKSPPRKSTSLDIFKRTSRSQTAPTLPVYTPAPPEVLPSPEPSPSSRYSRTTNDTCRNFFGIGRKRESLAPPLPINISGPLNVNPQFAHLVQRPDSTLHPSRTGESETQRWKI